MSQLREACERYLQLRRALGYQLRGVGTLLRSFVTFAEGEKAAHVTTDVALRWAQQSPNVQAATWADRLRVVRCALPSGSAPRDPQTQVPPAELATPAAPPPAAVHLP